MNYYKHYLGDYARDTAHLSLLEHGAYRVLLDTYYATERSLPADKASLYRICKAFSAAERKAVDAVAEQFFPLNGDGSRHNVRADEELVLARSFSEVQARRAQSRWHKSGNAGGIPPASPPASSGHSPGNALHNHNHNQTPEKPKNKKSKAIARSADASSPIRLGEGPEIEAIPLVGDRVATVCQSHVAELERLYPGVDVPQTLKEIRGWNLANPTRRKTPAGIAKHINAWCAREQNKA